MTNINTFCFYHSSTIATSSCERCNRPVCSKCSYSVENSTLDVYDKIDIKKFLSESEDDQDLSSEDVYWCYPCYYDFLNQKRQKNESSFHKMKRIETNFILSILAPIFTFWFISIVFSENDMQFKVDNNIILASLLIFIIVFLFTLINNKRTFRKEKIQFDENINDYFNDLGLPSVEFPITCYYCDKEINSDSTTCLNINCSLGEKIDENAKEFKLDLSDERIFETLSQLPKDSNK